MMLRKLLLLSFFASSTAFAQSQPIVLPMEPEKPDAHGCLASAGATWSVIKNKCVRLWTVGTKLYPTDYHGMVHYVVWADDKKTVEVFLIKGEPFIMKMDMPGVYSYKTYTLNTASGIQLKDNGMIIATETQPVVGTPPLAPDDGNLQVIPLEVQGNPGQVTFLQGNHTIFYYDQHSKKGHIRLNGVDFVITNYKFSNKDSYTLSGAGVTISALKCRYKKNKGEDCFYGSFAVVTVKAEGKTLLLKGVKVQDCPQY